MLSEKPYIIRRTYKDSLFVHLFSQKEYVIRLYHELHPEDTAPLREDEIQIVTMSHIFISGQYNDLGFLIRGTLLVLVESQSVWSDNIIYRLLGYIVSTWDKIISATEQNIYGSKKLELPVPDCFVIYTGKQEVPERLDLKDFFEENRQMIRLSATVITQDRAVKNGIIYQYIEQCRIMDHCMKKFGDDPSRCVEEYLRICKNEGILSEYFQKFEEEVRIMALRWITQEEAERMRDRAHARELRELNEIIAADREIIAKNESKIAETESRITETKNKIAEKDREIEKLKKLLEENNISLISTK